ncbi:MAG: Gfo/Idh/MocA family oxidoreductase [Candidatus Hydrogenedentes bacterium]|nr:Gfo/Idh/MocA family oxidoreductase [Candidatus Hydrogenedentota bacterium]
MSKKVRLGFIGAGGVAAGHFNRLMATGKAEIAALADPAPEALARFQKRCPDSRGIPFFPDYESMIGSVDLDGVLVLSPHACHFEQIMTCLGQGLHVLSEKPFVCGSRNARKAIDRARKSGKVLSLSFQRHYEPVFRYMRETIRRGALGEIQFVQAMQAQEWLRLTEGTWRQSLEISGGGQLNDSGSHLIDIVLWVTGVPVVEVFAQSEYFGREVDINSAITMKFANGALANLSVIGNAPAWHEDHTIVGASGAFYLRQDGSLLQQDAKGRTKTVRLPKHTQNPDSNFVQCILGRAVTDTPPECGLETLRVTEALWQSARLGRPVKLK